MDWRERRAKKKRRGNKDVVLQGNKGQRTQEPLWLWRGQISNHRAGGHGRLLASVMMIIRMITGNKMLALMMIYVVLCNAICTR